MNKMISAKNLKFSIKSDENVYLCYYYTVNKDNLYQTFYGKQYFVNFMDWRSTLGL